VLDPQARKHCERLLALLDDRLEGTMISGTAAWSSSGADFGFVTSAMTIVVALRVAVVAGKQQQKQKRRPCYASVSGGRLGLTNPGGHLVWRTRAAALLGLKASNDMFSQTPRLFINRHDGS
jgi:hypothetical protein